MILLLYFTDYKFELSGTSKLLYASKLLDGNMKLMDSFASNEKLNLAVIMKVVDVPDLSSYGIGVFFDFPRDGFKQIGWIPKKYKAEMEQVLACSRRVRCFVSSVNVKEISANFNRIIIVLQIEID